MACSNRTTMMVSLRVAQTQRASITQRAMLLNALWACFIPDDSLRVKQVVVLFSSPNCGTIYTNVLILQTLVRAQGNVGEYNNCQPDCTHHEFWCSTQHPLVLLKDDTIFGGMNRGMVTRFGISKRYKCTNYYLSVSVFLTENSTI